MFHALRRAWTWSVVLCAAIGPTACLPIENNPTDGAIDAAADADADADEGTDIEQVLSGTPESRHVEVEPNDDFDAAEVLFITDGVELVGSLEAGIDLPARDLFEIGPVEVGDRILGSLTTEPGADVVVGVLDDAGRLLGFVDPTSSTSGPQVMDIPVHEATDRLYVVTASRTGTPIGLDYAAQVSVGRGAGLPPYRPQVIVLGFDGGEDVQIGGRLPVDVDPFDAARIDETYTGWTEAIIANILEIVREDYRGLDVEIYRSGDPGIPPGERSVIYFGTYDNRLLGLADNIDPLNQDLSQSAILYTDTFSLFSSLSPSVEEISQALANVTSHEAGHLLGLRHTRDPSDLMDVTATARQMLLDQWFDTVPLHETVLPIGVQDGPGMLAWTLGGELEVSPAAKVVARRRIVATTGGPDDFDVPRWRLMTCGGEPDAD